MKDWNYYKTNNKVYHSFREIEKAMIAGIDSQRLTKAERDKALADVKQKARGRVAELNKPYYELINRLVKEFWKDAREELGYTKQLPEKAWIAMERKAWEDGHASGLSNVFYHLQELTEFAETIIDSIGEKV